jgi:hypothetical protein
MWLTLQRRYVPPCCCCVLLLLLQVLNRSVFWRLCKGVRDAASHEVSRDPSISKGLQVLMNCTVHRCGSVCMVLVAVVVQTPVASVIRMQCWIITRCTSQAVSMLGTSG